MTCPEVRKQLQAFHDGQLDRAASDAVSEHLSQCPECMSILESEEKLSRALRQPELRFTPPSGAEARLRQRLKPQRATPASRWWLAAAAALLLVGLGVTWISLSVSAEKQLALETVSDHIRSLQANHLTDVVSTDNHTVKPWFNGKIDFSPTVQDLAARGYELSGGRLDYLGGRPVAALVYRRRLHVINVFTWPAAERDRGPSQVLTQQGYNVVRWSHAGMTYWAVSDLASPELLDLANLLRE
ncbi:MAG TPA: anti-sigma factor [Bryobacteraceae bacterium]|jgi:anti-sigma factor RsiW